MWLPSRLILGTHLTMSDMSSPSPLMSQLFLLSQSVTPTVDLKVLIYVVLKRFIVILVSALVSAAHINTGLTAVLWILFLLMCTYLFRHVMSCRLSDILADLLTCKHTLSYRILLLDVIAPRYLKGISVANLYWLSLPLSWILIPARCIILPSG